jgi:prolipoprotein diacylglyceryl transferase
MFVHNLNPVLAEFFGLKIYYYGVAYALLFLCSYYVGRWFLRKHGKDPEMADNLLLIAFISVIVGARLGHIFFYSFEYYSQNPIEIFYIWEGGLASHGAAIALILGTWVMMKISKLRFFVLSDLVVICASLSVIFIRIGNFINGEIVGRITDSPLGVVFPCNGLVRGVCGEQMRHAVQIYEALLGVLMFGVLMFLFRKIGVKYPGILTGVFLIGYFGGRFLLEFFKEYDGTLMFPPLTNGHVLSIPMVLLGIWIVFKAYRSNKETH